MTTEIEREGWVVTVFFFILFIVAQFVVGVAPLEQIFLTLFGVVILGAAYYTGQASGIRLATEKDRADRMSDAKRPNPVQRDFG